MDQGGDRPPAHSRHRSGESHETRLWLPLWLELWFRMVCTAKLCPLAGPDGLTCMSCSRQMDTALRGERHVLHVLCKFGTIGHRIGILRTIVYVVSDSVHSTVLRLIRFCTA